MEALPYPIFWFVGRLYLEQYWIFEAPSKNIQIPVAEESPFLGNNTAIIETNVRPG